MFFSPKNDDYIKNQIAGILGIRRMALQDKYVGVPILIQKNKMETFGHLEERFKDQLATWKGKYFNQPARTVLTQHVLGSLVSHHLSFSQCQKN